MTMQRIRSTAVAIVAVAMVLYHMISTQYMLVDSMRHDNLHLAFSLLLVFLSLLGRSRWQTVTGLIGVGLTLFVSIYRYLYMADLEMFSGLPSGYLEVAISIILLLIVFEAVRNSWGWILPGVGAIAVVYFFLKGGLPWDFTLGRMALAESGLYGFILRTSANFIFLFVLFGVLLNTCGASAFFIETSKILQNRFTAGASFSIVGSGALLGMVSSAPPATSAMLCSFGLPLMKKSGYPPEQTAGIISVSGTGGFIMPPILGAVAFVMVSWIGAPYIRIVGASLIPALLYYLGLSLYCHFHAKKIGVTRVPTGVDYRKIIYRSPLFILPLCILLYFLINGYPLPYTIFWTILCLIVLSYISRETRPSLKQWLTGVTEGAVLGAQIGVLCALIGLIPLAMGSTGLGVTLPQMVLGLGEGNIFLILLITAALSIVLGCGVPVIAVYVMLAMVASPPLVKLGFNDLQAHFFIFYFATLSFITPPVAPAVFVTAKMSQANIVRSGLEAVKAGAGGFFAPFFFVTFPGLLLLPDKWYVTVAGIALAVIFVLVFEAAQCNYFLTFLNRFERAMLFISALLIACILYNPAYYLLAIAGVVVFLVVLAMQLAGKKSRSQARDH